MNKYLFSLAIILIASLSAFSQILDNLGVVSPGNEIRDLAVKGNTLYAAVGQGGVMYSNDEGYTWTACSPLPENGFGVESAYSILVASNGDLIIGGNQLYNGNPFSGACFRSSDNGLTWTGVPITGYAGYEESGKIVELTDGSLMMRGGFQKLFISSLTEEAWIQTTSPGGVIYGFEQINDEVFVVNNPASGTAGTWTTTDLGASWQQYDGNGTPVESGTVTLAPILQSGDYKFIGIGGTYEPRGMYRSGVSDALWVQKNNGIGESGIYPICMATDHQTIWMIMQNQAGTCMFTETADYGDNWTTAISGLPNSGGSLPCPEKMVVFGTHLYAYSGESIYRIEDVAVPLSVDENQFSEEAISFYPNPVTNLLRIDSDIPLTKVEFYSILGNKVKEINSDFISIPTNNLSNGIYLVKMFSKNGSTTKKLIKH